MIRRIPFNTREIIIADPIRFTNTWDNWTLTSNELCLNKIIQSFDIKTTYIDKWITFKVLKRELIDYLEFNRKVEKQEFLIYTNSSYNCKHDQLYTESTL